MFNVIDGQTLHRVHTFRKANAEWMRDREKYKLDPKLERDLKPGWLLPYLLQGDLLSWQRWDYWVEMASTGKLSDRPIPKIQWATDGQSRSMFDQQGHQHIERCLDLVPNEGRGSWRGWSRWDNVNYFFDWLLYGFGHPGYELPTEFRDMKGASMRLYQTFNLNLLLAFPHDYFGDILALNNFGKRSGFYPTPMPVCVCMTEMLMHDVITCDRRDSRLESVCDPCVGTGRMLLTASNYSLNLHGQDINETVIKATLINGYLYAPWLASALPFFSREDSAEASDRMTEAAPPQAVEYLADTEHDSEQQYKFEPIKKRRKKGDDTAFQGVLF